VRIFIQCHGVNAWGFGRFEFFGITTGAHLPGLCRGPREFVKWENSYTLRKNPRSTGWLAMANELAGAFPARGLFPRDLLPQKNEESWKNSETSVGKHRSHP
jgi:hypothetical protein